MDNHYYLSVFRSRLDAARDAVIDYIFDYLRRRQVINEDTCVELIWRHCQQTTGVSVSLDFFIGAMLASGYKVVGQDGCCYTNLSKRSPLIRRFTPRL